MRISSRARLRAFATAHAAHAGQASQTTTARNKSPAVIRELAASRPKITDADTFASDMRHSS